MSTPRAEPVELVSIGTEVEHKNFERLARHINLLQVEVRNGGMKSAQVSSFG